MPLYVGGSLDLWLDKAPRSAELLLQLMHQVGHVCVIHDRSEALTLWYLEALASRPTSPPTSRYPQRYSSDEYSHASPRYAPLLCMLATPLCAHFACVVDGSDVWVLKLGDFDVSLDMATRTSVAATVGMTRIGGREDYTAPELKPPRNAKATFASDMYAVGKVFQALARFMEPSEDLLGLIESLLDPEPSRRPDARACIENRQVSPRPRRRSFVCSHPMSACQCVWCPAKDRRLKLGDMESRGACTHAGTGSLPCVCGRHCPNSLVMLFTGGSLPSPEGAKLTRRGVRFPRGKASRIAGALSCTTPRYQLVPHVGVSLGGSTEAERYPRSARSECGPFLLAAQDGMLTHYGVC